MLKIWQSFLLKWGGDLPEKTLGYGPVKLISPCTNSYMHIQKWNASWTVLTHTHTQVCWNGMSAYSLNYVNPRHFWWKCITGTRGGFVPTLESHTHVYCGESLSRLPHTMQHQAADWIERKIREHTSVKHPLVILLFYFYWPPKNEMATWAKKCEF